MREIELLKKYDLKVTPQRMAIVEFLSLHGHLSISKMYELMQERFPTLSLATIYKNIHAMVDNRFINEVKIIGEDSRYELSKASHSHLVCKECGDVLDIELSNSGLNREIYKKSEFKVDDSSFVFYGVCKSCQ